MKLIFKIDLFHLKRYKGAEVNGMVEYLQCTLNKVDSNRGISVALFDASQRYCA